jgi:sugar/nucleoside kinase (ribokinase family)
MIEKVVEMAEGDAALAEIEGTASPKEGVAPVGKPVGGRKLNAQNTGSQDGQRAKLVTRLANDRRGAFAVASAAGVHEDTTRVVRFGPVTDGRGFYLLDKDFAHAFVVPE